MEVLEEIKINTMNENTLYYFIKRFTKEPLTLKDELKYLSELEPDTIIKITEMKRTLYNKKYQTQEIIDFVKSLKSKNQAFYELVCLATIISCYTALVNHYKIDIIKKHRQRKIRTKNLEEKIIANFTEIEIKRKEGKSWKDIVKWLKSNHRRQFEKYKLDASYLRKTYNKYHSDL